MVNKIKIYILLVLSLILTTNCKNSQDDYFADPSWLEKPLYEVLQNEGNYTNYLACIDRTLYAGQIKEGGYFTLMAPNDEAFAVYLQQNGYNSVADIPQDEVNKLVAYSMVQSYWLSENLGDVFIGQTDYRYRTGDGLKKQTYYYETLYKDPEHNNDWVIDQNTTGTTYAQSADNNFKYYPVFMQAYFTKSGLTSNDYNTFFPDVSYIGGQTAENGEIGNIYNGAIVKPNMKARNGIAHGVSVVNMPLDNMDKYLSKESQYSEFKSLLDFKDLTGNFIYKNYTEDVSLTERYKVIRPNDGISKIYVKSYNTSGEQPLSFSPALEVIYFDGAKTTQSDGYTLFVPSNEALTNYINNRLLKYYDNLNELPIEAITTLINTHMVNTMIWPSQFKTSQVSTGEYVNGKGSSGNGYDDFGVLDKKLTSNGFIYTIDHVIKCKLFETVYSEVFLNPTYSFLNAAYIKYYQNSIREDMMKSILTGYPNQRYTALLISDDQFKNDGFTFNTETSTFSNNILVNTNVTDRQKKLMRLHLFDGWVDNTVNSEVTFEDGITDYGGWGFRTSNGGDVVRYKNNQLQATGNIEDNTLVNITKGETFDNGTVYTMDNMLQYSRRESSPSTKEGWNYNTLWYYIQQSGVENPNVSQFVEYIQYSLKATDSDELLGISEDNFYTIVMPNNNALTRARTAGDIPNLDSLKNGLLSTERVEMVMNFCKAHFLQGYQLPDDRLLYLYPYNINSPYTNIVSTMYRINKESVGLINQRTNVTVSKDDAGKLVFTPEDVVIDGNVMVKGSYGLTLVARIMTGTSKSGNNGYRSNRICGRAIHHEFSNYFKFAIQN